VKNAPVGGILGALKAQRKSNYCWKFNWSEDIKSFFWLQLKK
jgi:hypothetical protein